MTTKDILDRQAQSLDWLNRHKTLPNPVCQHDGQEILFMCNVRFLLPFVTQSVGIRPTLCKLDDRYLNQMKSQILTYVYQSVMIEEGKPSGDG